jgi:hypothetical protein
MSEMGKATRCINCDHVQCPICDRRYSSRNTPVPISARGPRYEGEEGAAIFGRLLACPQQPAGGVVGDPGSSRLLPIPPDPPDATDRPTVKNRHNDQRVEGPAGSGRGAGLTLGGDSAQSAPSSPGRNHNRCHRRSAVSRASHPARSRSGARASADRS